MPPAAVAQPNTLHRRVLGIDAASRPMTAQEIERLNDPFGRLLRSGAPFPLTLRDLLASVDRLAGADAKPTQLQFMAAQRAHNRWSPDTDALQPSLR